MCEIRINPEENEDAADVLWIDELEEFLEPFHRRYADRALSAHPGRTRNVFVMPNGYVVKIPKNLDGFADNDWEGSVSNSEESLGSDDFVQYARTRLAYLDECPIVFMEEVVHASEKEIEKRLGFVPDWVGSVDCGQVGFNRAGLLVAYDYGVK